MGSKAKFIEVEGNLNCRHIENIEVGDDGDERGTCKLCGRVKNYSAHWRSYGKRKYILMKMREKSAGAILSR